MGYWGWRPMICGVVLSVWVAGCNIVVERSTQTTPTDYPQVTLTVGRLSALQSPSPLPTPTTLSPTASADDLLMDAPTCYESSAGGTICLGLLESRADVPLSLSLVEMAVNLHRGDPADAARLAEMRVPFEQSILLPDGIAPYRAVFDVPFDPAWIAQSRLNTPALPAENFENTAIIPEPIEGEWIGGSYRVHADLINMGTDEALLERAIVTLRDPAGRVIGYRVVSYDGRRLTRGERLALQVQIVPFSRPGETPPETPQITIDVEAHPLRDE